MKLFAQSTLTVQSGGFVKAYLTKQSDYSSRFDPSTGGEIKYLGLQQGTKIRVTIEVIEDSDD